MEAVNRPVCYMDISIAGKYAGRVTYQLFSDIVPRTAENFRALCTGERGFGYRGCHFHRIVPGLLCQTGDITNNNGLGGRSIYGAKFDDENFAQAHAGPGILSMANAGANTNGSQFFVTLAKQPSTWLDGKHVVFGQVVKGMKVIREIEKWGTVNGKPQKYCVIMDSGELTQ